MGHGGSYHLLLILLLGPGPRSSFGGLLAERSTKPPPTLTSRIVSEANPGGGVAIFGFRAARQFRDLFFFSALMRIVTKTTAPNARSLVIGRLPRLQLLERSMRKRPLTARARTGTVVSKGRHDQPSIYSVLVWCSSCCAQMRLAWYVLIR